MVIHVFKICFGVIFTSFVITYVSLIILSRFYICAETVLGIIPAETPLMVYHRPYMFCMVYNQYDQKQTQTSTTNSFNNDNQMNYKVPGMWELVNATRNAFVFRAQEYPGTCQILQRIQPIKWGDRIALWSYHG